MIKNFFLKDEKLRLWFLAFLIIMPIITSLYALSIGRISISLREIFVFFASYIHKQDYQPMMESVIINVRLPRIITALLVGSGLSLAGIALQGVFSNPLATPDILGVSQASSLGAVIGILLSLGSLSIQVLSIISGLIGVLFTLRIGAKKSHMTSLSLILSGLVISSLSNAILSLLKYTADPYDKLPEISYWLMGSFVRASFKNILVSLPLILGAIAIICIFSFRLNILSLSEDEARSLGVDVNKTRLIMIFASTIITAASISLCGQVGFIGLIIPHIARMTFGPNTVKSIPISLSLGASLMVIIEALSRSLSVIELPISILTSILAAPIFISLIRQKRGIFI